MHVFYFRKCLAYGFFMNAAELQKDGSEYTSVSLCFCLLTCMLYLCIVTRTIFDFFLFLLNSMIADEVCACSVININIKLKM